MKPAIDRLRSARTRLLIQQPFFGVVALSLVLLEDNSKPDLSVDGETIFFNKDWIAETTDAELTGAVAHETVHVALKHHFRRGDRDYELWNQACDYVANILVTDAGLIMPEPILLDYAYRGMSAEEVYDRLIQKEKEDEALRNDSEPSQCDRGAGNDFNDDTGNPNSDGESRGNSSKDTEGADPGGSESKDQGPDEGDELEGPEGEKSPENASADGETGSPEGEGSPELEKAAGGAEKGSSGGRETPERGDGSAWGRVIDAPEGIEEGPLEVILQQAANAGQAAGILPGYVKRILGELKSEKIDWREVIQRFIDSKVVTDYSFNRPNRRMVAQGLVMPSAHADGINKIGLIIDTSGSIDKNILSVFKDQLQSMFELDIIQEIIVLCVDDSLRSIQNFQKGDDLRDIEISGGGNTRFSPGLNWFRENEPDVSAIVYFTDLLCDQEYFGTVPNAPLLWAVWGHRSSYDRLIGKVPFGEGVYISEE